MLSHFILSLTWYTQNIAATNKIIDIDTTTVFISHISDQFLEKVIIKWKMLIISKHKHNNT